jgi:undecaprenyl-diphosphatase
MLLPVPSQLGYVALGGLILAESAGLPLPGETALITAGGPVAAGNLSLPLVILVGALAAIIGDTIGYWLGRRGGRALPGPRRSRRWRPSPGRPARCSWRPPG